MSGVKGGCLCGKVRFTANGVENHYHACHCSMCRRWGGAPAFAAMTTSVEFENEGDIGIYNSSDWADRGFCKHCGSSLFYRLKSGEHLVCVGAFDDPAPFKLVGEIFVDYQPDGYRFAGELTRQTEAEFLQQFVPQE